MLSTYLSPRTRASLQRAIALLSTVAILLVILTLISWSCNDFTVSAALPSSLAAKSLRVALIFSFFPMLGVSGSALAIGRSMPVSVGQIDSAVISAIHCVAVSLACLFIGVVGLSAAPILINAQDPRLIASLDIMLIPMIRLYMQYVLLEVVHAQNASPLILGLAARAAQTSELPCTLSVPRQTALLVVLNVLTCAGFTATRTIPSRTAAAVVFCLTVGSQVPAALGLSRACRALYGQSSTLPIFRRFGVLIQSVGLFVWIVQLVFEALYNFSPILPLGPVLADATFVLALYPIALLGVSASIIVDNLGRADLAAVLRQQAGANQALAESREQLLRWLAHEARVPLNSLYMGLQVRPESDDTLRSTQNTAPCIHDMKLLNSDDGSLRRMQPVPHEDVKTLSHCCSAAEALIGVLSDVLDVSKMDAKGVQLRLAPDSVEVMAADIVGQMRLMASGLGVALRLDMQMAGSVDTSTGLDLESGITDPSQVHAAMPAIENFGSQSANPPLSSPQSWLFDRPHVAQILANFISNAIKFSVSGASVIVRFKVLRQVRLQQARSPSVLPTPCDALKRKPLSSTPASSIHEAMNAASPQCIAEPSQYSVERFVGKVDPLQFARFAYRVEWEETTEGMQDPSKRQAVVDIVELSVDDCGCGISTDDAQLLFEAFQQVTAGQALSQFKGRSTGLGLAISRRIALAHHGEIGVRSSLGVGSSFVFRFPVVECGVSDVTTEILTPSWSCNTLSSVAPGSHTTTNELGLLAYRRSQYRALDNSEKQAVDGGVAQHTIMGCLSTLYILLVDDSSMNVRMLIRSLEQTLGQRVHLDIKTASDGFAGLALLQRHSSSADGELPFDVCLSDAEMPVMSGYQMTFAAKAAGVSTPIIGITGNALPDDVKRFIDAGAHSVIIKPVHMTELYATLQSVLPDKLPRVAGGAMHR